MQKLGLDLGSSSLGWALREDDKIEKRGVITFHSGMVKGQGGYSSPTKDRREARSKRRLIQSRKYRKWELLKVLVDEFVPLNKSELEVWCKYKKGQLRNFPENNLFLKWLNCDFSYLEEGINYENPYELRVKALDHKLSKHEFGRALYHLVQRRGYKDIGETDTETKKQIDRRGESGFKTALENNRTIAEALTKEFLNNSKRARNQYPYREEYQDELESICKGQGYDVSKNEKSDYKDQFVQILWKAIIWQRPLRSQKGNIGKCTLEPTKLRCPISHPIFEIFRTWSFINTIRYYDKDDKKQPLTEALRNQLFDFFLKKDKNFKFEDIRRFLDKYLNDKKVYNYPTDNKTGLYDTSVSGMPVCKGLISIWEDDGKKHVSNLHNYNIGNAPPIIHCYSFYDLWHILFEFDVRTAKDKNFLEKFSEEKLQIKREKNKKGKDIFQFVELKKNIVSGYSNLSLKAMCKIIPFLKEGYLYNEAVVLAKMPELLAEKWHTEKDKILGILKESNKIYDLNKTTIGITNNLIDQYKGLESHEKFACKDFQYTLVQDDINDVKKKCIGYFGEKSWNSKTDKDEILKNVKEQYQAFFNNPKRSFRQVPLFTNIFQSSLKENNIEINGQLYHHSNRENIYGDTILDKKIGVEILPEPQMDSIKNPMFNKAMSLLRRLINELIKANEIDSDTEVVIEVARDLNDNNKRAAIELYQKNRRDNREKYREFLNEFKEKENRSLNIEESILVFELWTEQTFEETEDESKKKITNKKNIDILKEKETVKRYELWMEQRGQCIYTGKTISMTQLFSNEIDIEHTIPRSLLPDNTMANQTVCFAKYNRDEKNNELPSKLGNYYQDWKGYTAILPRLDNWRQTRDGFKTRYEDRLKPKGNEDELTKNTRIKEKHYFRMHYAYWKDKVERFEAEEVKDSWARRQLVDTQIISKYAREFLKTYFKKVAVQKGSVTADFRKIFGFQEEDEIKNRNKHTHHAIDAAVLTLIPVNSSQRDRLLKNMYEMNEKENKQFTITPFPSFNSQKLIQDIENKTLIVNYEKDNLVKQTYRNIRKRGKLQYVKDKNGKFIKDTNNKKILKTAKGDSIRSTLFKDTFVAKIKDVERYSDGQPIREGNNWKYKKDKEEFIYVVRKPIKDVISKIEDIIDPVIKELVRKQKNNSEIKDYQGNIIRHVRIKSSTGQKVKERINYLSKHEHKNHYYSAAGSLPYAILLQKSNQGNVEREMIPIASFEVAKMCKKSGIFDIEEYLKENYPDLTNYTDKKLLKIGQKLIVLNNDKEYEKRNNMDFITKRLYFITQFSDGSIWLKYHLEAQAKDDIKHATYQIKNTILRKYEIQYELSEVIEDNTIEDKKLRKDDFERRKFSFAQLDNFRYKRLIEKIGIEKTKEIKKELDKYKAISASISDETEGKTPLLKMAKENWNFLYEGDDFEIPLLGKIRILKHD